MRITEGTDPEVLTAIKYSAACPFPRNCIVANRVEMTAPSNMPDLNNACYQLTVAVAEPRYLIQSMNRIWLREWCEPLNIGKMARGNHVREKITASLFWELRDKPYSADLVAYSNTQISITNDDL